MKKQHALLKTVAMTAVALLSLSVPLVSGAQGGGNNNGGGRQPGRSGRFGGPGGMFGPGGMSTIDPVRSNLMGLLQRNDVGRTLLIDARQREQIAELQKQSTSEMGQKMRAQFQELQKLTKDMTPEERRTHMQNNAGGAFQDMFSALQEIQEKKLLPILGSTKLKRLKEIDLQWRGPLAIGDKRVSDQLQLDQDQMTQMSALMQEYRQSQGKAFQAAFAGLRGNRNPGTDPNAGNDPNQPSAPPSQEDLQEKMNIAQQEMEKTRTALGKKMLALLSAEQTQRWEALVGKKFTFLKD